MVKLTKDKLKDCVKVHLRKFPQATLEQFEFSRKGTHLIVPRQQVNSLI